MKISISLLPAIVICQDVDGGTAHLGGCIWPDTGVLGTKMSHADDPYAKFESLGATGTGSPYAEGTEIQKQCPSSCEYDGSDYVNCSGYSNDILFKCGYKDGKNNRPQGRHFVFVDGARPKSQALFFRTSRLDKYRPVPPHKLCPKPTISIGDTDSVCGDKPAIPEDDNAQSADFTHWTANGLSVACNEGARPIRANNFEQLNLVCDRQKPTKPYKWFHQSPNGKLRPAGNKWIKARFLCRFCHDCEPETSGDEPEGSGGDSPDNAEVTL